MKTLIGKFVAAAGVLSLTATFSVAQNVNGLEIARANPEGAAKSRTVALEIAGQKRNIRIDDPAPITQAQVSRVAVMKEKIKVTSGDKPETKEISVIRINLNSTGAKTLADLTKDWQGKLIAIVVDGKVVATPKVAKAITGGEVTVSGNFTPEEAKTLAAKIQGAAGKR